VTAHFTIAFAIAGGVFAAFGLATTCKAASTADDGSCSVASLCYALALLAAGVFVVAVAVVFGAVS